MNKIETILLDIGISASNRGFKYLSDALNLALSDSEYIYGTTTKLYPELAKMNTTKPASIERCIRHSIEGAFASINPEIAGKYFGNSINTSRAKPTNSMFIASVALYLKRMEGDVA